VQIRDPRALLIDRDLIMGGASPIDGCVVADLTWLAKMFASALLDVPA